MPFRPLARAWFNRKISLWYNFPLELRTISVVRYIRVRPYNRVQ